MVRRLLDISPAGAVAATGSYTLGYVLIRLSGIFSPFPPSVLRILHEGPALAGLFFLAIGLVVQLFSRRGPNVRIDLPSRSGRALGFFYMGAMLAIVGVLLSSLTRFEGRILLPEGESFAGDPGGYLGNTVYKGRFASYPPVHISLTKVSYSLRSGGNAAGNLSSQIMYSGRPAIPKRPLNVNSVFPSYRDMTFLRIIEGGYSPLVRVYNPKGEIVEEGSPLLRLIPPGREDAFRFDLLPETFYLKYYPDRSMVRGPSEPLPEGAGDLFKLRATRNLDIISNKYVLPYTITMLDEMLISLEDVRMWAEIQIVRDYGLFLILPGLGMILAALLWGRLRGVNLIREILSPMRE